MKITVDRITVITSKESSLYRAVGPDSVVLFLGEELEEATYPYRGPLSVSFRAAAQTGEEYAKKNFPGVPIEVIRV